MRVLPPARSQTVVDPSVSRPPGDQPPAAVLAAVESAIVESDGKGSVWLVRTTLKAATESAIPGKEYVAADGSRRIWLAVQNGDFVIPDHVPGPPGAQSQAKPGHSQWVMMSDDGSVIGMVISPNAAGDLSSLGDVRTITVGQGNTSPSPPINSGAPAPATRPVTYQGVTVDVPADWPVNQVPRCNFGELAAGSVLIPPVAFACVGGAPAQTTTTVSFGWSTRMPDSDPLEPITWTSTGATMIGGLPAVTAVGTRPNKPEEQDRKPGPTLAVRGLYVPDRKTAIVVSTLDPAVAEQILATARITDIDANGCPYRDEDTLALPTKPRSEVTGMDKAILPGTPESISVCKYAEGWLQAGETLDSQERAELQKLLGAAPIGTFRLDTKTYSPDMCRNPKAPIGTVRQLGSGDAEGFVLTATYPDGSRVTALARIAWCGDLGVSNGAHTVQPTIQIATFLTQFAHGGSFSGLLPGSPR